MSYVRLSSDDFQSDFYIYDHVGGYIAMHMAARRHIRPPSKNPYDPVKQTDEWMKWGTEEIDLPEAGKMFTFGDMEDCIRKCEELIEKGFRAPDWMLDALREEVA